MPGFHVDPLLPIHLSLFVLADRRYIYSLRFDTCTHCITTLNAYISSNMYYFLMAKHSKFFFLAQNKSVLVSMLTRSIVGKKNPKLFFLVLCGGREKEAFTLNSSVLAIHADLVVIAGRGTTYIRTMPARSATQ